MTGAFQRTVAWAAAVATVLILTAATLPAETLLIDALDGESQKAQQVPARGMTMERVETVFGAPLVKHRAVGDPPISRWEYSEFVVYFEYRHVIHSVSKRQARAR